MKKPVKIFSLLLIVTLICAMIPTIMAAGQPEVTLDNSKLGDAVLEMGTPSSYTDLYDLDAGSITKARNAVANYQRLPRNTLVGIGTVTPVNYMIPVEGSVEVSNPDIIGECSFSLNGWNGGGFTTVPPCLQFNYKTLHTGTTTVKLTYFYNYGLVNVSGGTRWYKETATFTVNVTEDEVRAPEKPTETDAERFRNYVNSTSSSKGAVYMWCAENLYDHGAWFDYLTDVEGGYSFGEVVANDGSIKAAPANQYPWMCEMTVYADAYLNAYNEALAADCGTHYLCEGEPETQTFKWFHNGTRWFFVSSNAPVYIDITHTAPVREYTVTYTDGVEGEEIFENQSYTVKEGEATPAFNGSRGLCVPRLDARSCANRYGGRYVHRSVGGKADRRHRQDQRQKRHAAVPARYLYRDCDGQYLRRYPACPDGQQGRCSSGIPADRHLRQRGRQDHDLPL